VPLVVSANIYNLADDFDYPNNPNADGWAYINPATSLPLSPHLPINDGNPLYPALASGIFSTGPFLDLDVPFVFKAAVSGASAGLTNGDFLQGDAVVHSPNADGNALIIQWTAPEAGWIDFTSDIWYAHSPVDRINNVTIALNLNPITSATISKASYGNRNNPWHVAINDLAVNQGDSLQFLFSKAPNQQFGSLNGIAVTIDFTAIPEPGTALLVVTAGGLLGLMLRRRC
jgi:hypothetical protein